MTTPRTGSTDAGSALYVFAVCRDADPSAVAAVPGFEGGETVRTLSFGPLTAVVQTVPAADFTDEVWQARLGDRGELERYARAHHDVVTAVAASAPTVPLPMATLYHGEDSALTALADRAAGFERVLARVAHHAEWGVKVYVPASPVPEPEAETEPEPAPEAAAAPARSAAAVGSGPAGRTPPAPGAGLAYLNRRRGVQRRRERHQVEAGRAADTVDAAFREVAVEARRLRLHDAQDTADRRVHVLNATYLVADERAAELAHLARSLRESSGAEVVLSGPWVPYSFVGEGVDA
ncbi:GvpL/GvpF family gas vesicle protein [uncultured Streptomyces sp.]|uniref:GvpL/GvpF family gas vesicle protein n=1 Tax=uncultured Streptomyces sp. TaxID=174707 RepID=UPI0026076DD8|nr:GvpL/GvpF family gas vesicle protein [uncultured Streptomyces sp.]